MQGLPSRVSGAAVIRSKAMALMASVRGVFGRDPVGGCAVLGGAEQARRRDLGGAVEGGAVAQEAPHDTESPGPVAGIGR
jgi:hypothetical protein